MHHPKFYNTIILALSLLPGFLWIQTDLAQGGTWSTVASIPEARSVPAANVIDGIMYVAGGYNGGDTPTLQTYNTMTDTWSVLTSMPGGRYAGDGAGVINGQLLVPGGWTTSPPLPNNNLFAFDPITNAWSIQASMPILSGCGASGVIDEKIYVITPCDGFSGYRTYLHVGDPATNSWTSLASTPIVHVDPAAGVIGGKFYVVGGHDETTLTAQLDVYDPMTNTWTTAAPMPTARYGAAGAVLNGKLYVLGGTDLAGIFYSTVEVYDPVTNTWASETSMPTARSGLVAGVANGVLYAVGGSNSSGLLSTVEAFTPTWSTKSPIPEARSVPAANVIDGIMYVAGGYNGGDTPTLQTYNTMTDTWSVLTSMPGGRYAGDGAGVINGQLLVPGGWTTSPPLPNNNLFAFDPITNAWSIQASMPILSGCGASGVIDEKIYVITPCDGFSGYRTYLHVGDPATNSWTSLASTPIVHVDPAAGVIGGKFYVVGGHDETTLTAQLDVYDPMTNTWTTAAPMPTARYGAAGAVLNGKLYVLGGTDLAGIFYSTVEVYDPVTNTWASEASMPTARSGLVAGVANGVLYAVGGSNSSGILSTVEAFAPSVTQIPCTDITSMAARCIGGGTKTIQVRVNLLNSIIHAGEQITIAIDGNPFTATIISNGTHSRANFSIAGWPVGIHTVSLVNPAGCLADKHPTCSAGDGIAKGDPEWDDDAEWTENVHDVPQATQLLGNYPNPFNPTSTIQYTLSDDALVTLRVYNMLGQVVATLVDEPQTAGYKSVVWSGRNDSGVSVASGIYIYRMRADNFTATKRMLLLK